MGSFGRVKVAMKVGSPGVGALFLYQLSQAALCGERVGVSNCNFPP